MAHAEQVSVYQNPFVRTGLALSGLALIGSTIAACGSDSQQTDPTAAPSVFPSTSIESTPPFKAPISEKAFPNCSPDIRKAAIPTFESGYQSYLSAYQQPDVTQDDVTQQATTAIGDLNKAVQLLPPTNVYDILAQGKMYFRQIPSTTTNGTEISYVVNSNTTADATSCTAYDLRVQSAGTTLTLDMTGIGAYSLHGNANKPLTMANGQPVSREAVAELNAITDEAVDELTKLAGGH